MAPLTPSKYKSKNQEFRKIKGWLEPNKPAKEAAKEGEEKPQPDAS